jgi:hypothetical protein
MARFNVGDKVTVRSLKNMKKEFTEDSDGLCTTSGIYFVSDMNKYCGKTVTIAGVHKAGYRIKEDGGHWNWTDEMFEGHTIIIYTDNNKVVALDKGTGETGIAYCSPEDEFNFFAGADIAYNRLRGREKPARKYEAAKYYNGEVVCTKTRAHYLTKGKIYKIKNGKFVDDCGVVHGDVHPYINFDDFNSQYFSEFIEVVR